MQLNDAAALIKNDYLLNEEEASAWADLGCGTGLFTHALSRYLKAGSRIYAVDRVTPFISDHENPAVEIIPLEADFETAILPIGKLDGILMANSLHYVREKRSFLTRCQKTFSNRTFLIVEYDTDAAVKNWVPYPVTFNSLSRLFRSVGFSHISKLGEHPSVFGRSPMYAAIIW